VLCLSVDLCIADLLLTHCTVGGDSCSHFTGNLDMFIPGNTGMKKSGNLRLTGNGSLGVNSLSLQ